MTRFKYILPKEPACQFFVGILTTKYALGASKYLKVNLKRQIYIKRPHPTYTHITLMENGEVIFWGELL